MFKAETHLGMFKAETHLGMYKAETIWWVCQGRDQLVGMSKGQPLPYYSTTLEPPVQGSLAPALQLPPDFSSPPQLPSFISNPDKLRPAAPSMFKAETHLGMYKAKTNWWVCPRPRPTGGHVQGKPSDERD